MTVDDPSRLFEAILSATPVHIYVYDREGRYVYVSPSGARIAELEPSAMIGRTWQDLDLPAEIMEPFHEDRRRTLAAGEPVTSEVSLHVEGSERRYAYTIGLLAEFGAGHTLATVLDVTEQRKRRDALAESEARFRAAFEYAPIGMALVDLDGRWRNVNRAICDIVGYTADELSRLTFQDITHPDDLDADLAQAARLRAGEISSYQIEKRYLHKDGHVVWVLLTGSAVRDPEGEPLYYIAQVQDVSERKRDAETQRMLTDILEATPDLVGTSDPQGRTIYLNAAARKMLLGGEELVGRHIAGFHPPDTASRILAEAVPTAIRDGVWTGDTVVLDANGHEHPASQVIVAHRGASGELRYLSTVMRDQTLARQTEARQRYLAKASRALSAAAGTDQVLSTLTELLVPTLADFCVVRLRATGERAGAVASSDVDPARQEALARFAAVDPGENLLVGESAVARTREAELVAELSPAWLHAATCDEAHLAALEALEPGSLLVLPLGRNRTVHGTVTCGRRQGSPRYGEPDRLLLEELTERASLVLENVRLYEQVRQAVHTRDEVLRVLSADLRALLGRAAAAAQGAPAPGGGEPPIYPALCEASRLVEDLLDLAGLDARDLTLETEPVSPLELMRGLERQARPEAERRGIRLHLRADEDLPRIVADRVRLLRVLSGLLGQALEVSPEGGCLTLTATAEGGEVRLSVTDTGPGMSPEEMADLFDPLVAPEGRGARALRLSVARGIAQAHGGDLQVQSEPSAGSTFTLVLPAERDPAVGTS